MGVAASASRLRVAGQNLRGYRGLTLDGYGSLLEGGPDELPRVLERTFSERGLPASPSVRDAWRKSLRTKYAADPFIAFREVHRQVFSELLAPVGVPRDLDSVIDEAFDEYRRAKAYPEVGSVLRDLQKEVAMAVVSNMDMAILLEALHRNGLSFTFVVASEEEQRYKPSASMFQRAIRYLGLPAANILHAGGSYFEDVVGATSLGMGSVLIQRSSSPNSPGTNARVLRDLGEVREFVRRSWE